MFICLFSFSITTSAVIEDNKHKNMGYGKHELYCDGTHNLCDCSFYESLLNITNGTASDYDWDNITGEPEGTGTVLSSEQVALFKNKQLAMSYQYSFDMLDKKFRNISGLDLCAEYEIYTSDKYMYNCAISIIDNPLVTAEMIFDITDIPSNAEITAVRFFEHIHIPENEDKDSDYWKAVYGKYITGLSFIDLSEKGWQETNGEKFYVKSDGTVITKSCKISDVRYKFTSDGVCHGKYTGWTKSTNGRRYYKDGVMITNKWIKTKSGKKYYAGEDGYMRTGWARVDGKTCYFDENGVWDGKVYDFISDISNSSEEKTTEFCSTEMISEIYTDNIVASNGTYYTNIAYDLSWKNYNWTTGDLFGTVLYNSKERRLSSRKPYSASILPIGTKLYYSNEDKTVIIADIDGKLIPYVKIVEG